MNQPHIIIGGGIIGLSIAYELARRNESVMVLERNRLGREASWAGAGILIPANGTTAIHPLEHLEALSQLVHEQWSTALRSQTGIDNGFRKCGGLYLARTAGEIAALTGVMAEWSERGIEHELLEHADARHRFPDLLGVWNANAPRAAWVPGESQICNPDHLKALTEACRQLGVELKENVGDVGLLIEQGHVRAAEVAGRRLTGANYVLTSGAWTEQLVHSSGVPLPMQPVRGQMALYKLDPDVHPSLANGPVINEGSRYLVPRRDGHVLAGATIEEVGFDCETTEVEIRQLRGWAQSMASCLNDATFVKSWAGLRPATYDGFPYLGRLNGWSSNQPSGLDLANVFVATGHFKAGLHLSTGTAIVMADLIQGKSPTIDLRPFDPSRAKNGAGAGQAPISVTGED